MEDHNIEAEMSARCSSSEEREANLVIISGKTIEIAQIWPHIAKMLQKYVPIFTKNLLKIDPI